MARKNTTKTGAEATRVERYVDLASHAKTDDAQRGLAIGRLAYVAKTGPNAEEVDGLAEAAKGTGTPEGERLQAIVRLGQLAVAAHRAAPKATKPQAGRDEEDSYTGYRLPTVWYGHKYDSKLSTVQIAKLIREEIKLSRKIGKTPSDGSLALVDLIADAPAGIKFSVRSKYFSGGSSIDITLSGIPQEWGWRKGTDWRNEWRGEVWMYTPALQALMDQLKAVMNAYNHNGSDAMVDYFDVNFYGGVDVAYSEIPR